MQRDVSLVRLLAGCALLLGVAAWGAGGSSAMPGATRDAVAASGTAGDPPFTFTARRIGPSMRARMTGSSWRPGCPVALSDLRLLRIGYWGFDRRAHVGRMIVAASAVDPVRRAFEELFGERFPIRRMRLIDDYDGSDHASDRGRQHLRVQLPEGHGFVALLRARVRPRHRRQPDSEPVRLSRRDHRPPGVAPLPGPLTAPARHGLPRRRPRAGVHPRRVVLGRRVEAAVGDRLPALLLDGPLAAATASR